MPAWFFLIEFLHSGNRNKKLKEKLQQTEQKEEKRLKKIKNVIFQINFWRIYIFSKATYKYPSEPESTFISWGIPANIYIIKFDNRNTRKRCEIFSKLTIKTPEQRH